MSFKITREMQGKFPSKEKGIKQKKVKKVIGYDIKEKLKFYKLRKNGTGIFMLWSHVRLVLLAKIQTSKLQHFKAILVKEVSS